MQKYSTYICPLVLVHITSTPTRTFAPVPAHSTGTLVPHLKVLSTAIKKVTHSIGTVALEYYTGTRVLYTVITK